MQQIVKNPPKNVHINSNEMKLAKGHQTKISMLIYDKAL